MKKITIFSFILIILFCSCNETEKYDRAVNRKSNPKFNISDDKKNDINYNYFIGKKFGLFYNSINEDTLWTMIDSLDEMQVNLHLRYPLNTMLLINLKGIPSGDSSYIIDFESLKNFKINNLIIARNKEIIFP